MNRIMLILLFSTSLFAQTTIGDFFQNLYQDFPRYVELRNREYKQLCDEFSIDSLSISNKNKIYNIYFIHDLLTENSAQDYSKGGILKIPYFWHWVKPNSRHEITYKPNSMKFNRVKPPKKYSNYKSCADIDRVPSLFLGDLLTDDPKYFHKGCSVFYTFGWCSEREMAFNALMEIMGFKSKIKQEGIHTWSEILVDFEAENNFTRSIVVRVDNTFDIFSDTSIRNNMSFEYNGPQKLDQRIRWII